MPWCCYDPGTVQDPICPQPVSNVPSYTSMYTPLDPANAVWKVIATFKVRLLPEPVADDPAALSVHWLFVKVAL
jgi:hypothetical protein